MIPVILWLHFCLLSSSWQYGSRKSSHISWSDPSHPSSNNLCPTHVSKFCFPAFGPLLCLRRRRAWGRGTGRSWKLHQWCWGFKVLWQGCGGVWMAIHYLPCVFLAPSGGSWLEEVMTEAEPKVGHLLVSLTLGWNCVLFCLWKLIWKQYEGWCGRDWKHQDQGTTSVFWIIRIRSVAVQRQGWTDWEWQMGGMISRAQGPTESQEERKSWKLGRIWAL